MPEKFFSYFLRLEVVSARSYKPLVGPHGVVLYVFGLINLGKYIIIIINNNELALKYLMGMLKLIQLVPI